MYFEQHLNNIIRRSPTTPRQIESGPIYDIRYNSETATKKRYLVMALNIYPYTGGEKDKKLHCLDMDNLPPRDMKIILKEAGGVQDMKVGNQIFKELKIPDGRENIQFYEKRIASITRQIKGVYKTLSLVKIKRVELCEYNFLRVVDPTTARKYGLLNEN